MEALFVLTHCSFRDAKDNIVIVLLMCLRHNGRCTTTAVSLVWAHHEFSCAGEGLERASLSQRYEEWKQLLCSPSCETTTTFMEDFPCHDESLCRRKKDNALALQRIDTYKLMLSFLLYWGRKCSSWKLQTAPQQNHSMSGIEDVKHLCDKWFWKYTTTAVKWFKLVQPFSTKTK